MPRLASVHVMAELDELATRFRDFGRSSAARAPLYGRLAQCIADEPEILELLGVAPAEQQLPVLLFAAVHHLVLRGDEPDLERFYPNLVGEPDSGDPFPTFRECCRRHSDALRALIATRSTQTNEVGRCSQFLPALGMLADEVGTLAHLDVGTSAGLNLLLPRYEYRFSPGGSVGGPSPVVLDCATRGGVPVPATLPDVGASIGIDIAPIDVREDEEVRWLEACVWPDQADRFARLVAAVELARQQPPDVRRGDAIGALPELVGEASAHGHPVVTNSWVLNYLTPSQRTAYVATLDELGNQRDLSWIIAESPAQTPELPIPAASPGEDITVLSMVTWRGGHRVVRRLATTHPHGFWVHWEHRGTTRQR